MRQEPNTGTIMENTQERCWHVWSGPHITWILAGNECHLDIPSSTWIVQGRPQGINGLGKGLQILFQTFYNSQWIENFRMGRCTFEMLFNDLHNYLDVFTNHYMYSLIIYGSCVWPSIYFRNINICWSSRVHDARNFANYCENGTLFPKWDKKVQFQGRKIAIPIVLLGDPA